ncbi:hypothetical protein [Halovivax cerinus]|uniref:hypothetical protein n=1 Tax=Halovivax cerinus TaxID=1487865 RepID=UPI0036D41B7D
MCDTGQYGPCFHAGIHPEGAFHCYRTIDETVHVIECGERVYRYGLTLTRSITNWFGYVAAQRGWAGQRFIEKSYRGSTERFRLCRSDPSIPTIRTVIGWWPSVTTDAELRWQF